MIETDIPKKYRENEVTKTGMLLWYIDTQLFSVKFPIKIIDNRKNFISNEASQNKYSYGSYLNLLSTKRHVKKEYSGSINIEYNGIPYNIEYYVILPYDEKKWRIDFECKKYLSNITCLAIQLYTLLMDKQLVQKNLLNYLNQVLFFKTQIVSYY